MHSGGYQILLAAGAQADVRSIKAKDSYAATHVLAHLQELRADIHLCACLVDEHYSDDLVDNVEPVWSFQKKGLNVYRIKYVRLGRWRLITAADHQRGRVAIMAVMPREADYEKDKDLWARIEKDYDDLDFPHLGR